MQGQPLTKVLPFPYPLSPNNNVRYIIIIIIIIITIMGILGCATSRRLPRLMLIYEEVPSLVQDNSTYPDAGYTDRLGSSGEHFVLYSIVLHLFMD